MFYELSALKGSKDISMNNYRGKVLLSVNTASHCGFTKQYKELEEIYNKIGNTKFEILAFPSNQFLNQEPGSDEEISSFCELNFGVTFPIFSKIEVRGKNIHPIYKYLTNSKLGLFGKSIKWNFTKFLLDHNGKVLKRYSPFISPLKIEEDILKAVNNINI